MIDPRKEAYQQLNDAYALGCRDGFTFKQRWLPVIAFALGMLAGWWLS